MSDPITTLPIPEHLRKNERLRAMCLSGALSYDEYLNKIIEAGFGIIEIRARRPYRVLDKQHYSVEQNILLESLELVTFKKPLSKDEAHVFTGETIIYFGTEKLSDEEGHIIPRNIPHPVSHKTACYFRKLNRSDIVITAPTYHYGGSGVGGGGCCG